MSIAIFVLGILMCVFGLVGYFLRKYGIRYDQHCTIVTKGQVVGIETVSSGDGPSYAPVIEFVDASGNQIRQKSFMSTTRRAVEKKCPIGAEVELRYDPLDSRKFLIDHYDINVLTIVGTAFLGVAMILLVVICGIYCGVFLFR